MDLKVGFVIVCLCALAITSTEAGIPKCCMATRSHIPNNVLRKVRHWEVQNDTGACDVHALVLHVNGKTRPICADPTLKPKLMKCPWINIQKKQVVN